MLMRDVRATPVGRALWHIERRYSGEVSLDDVARAAGISRFHLSRAFVAATGYPVLRYVRGRRLTDAARALADGAPDILTLALDAGYNSHEAFTRAFRDLFGVTPESVRAERRVNHLSLVEPLRMDKTASITLPPPAIIEKPTMLLAGLSVRYNCDDKAGIPSQWQRFSPHIGHIPGQIGNVAYGVVFNTDEEGNMDYMCAVQVSSFSDLPDGFSSLRVPGSRYAVFTHRGHISTIAVTLGAIWNSAIPSSGLEPSDAPLLEVYDERFDPVAGTGAVEICIAIRE